MYKTIAIAGTFDHLHKGHKFFIAEAFKLGEKVIIGLTSDEYVKQKLQITNDKLQINLKLQITNYETRRKELEKFLKEERLLERAEIVKIDDVYGPAISLKRSHLARLEALVVTEETYNGGLAVNRKREELGLSPLKLLKLPMILAQDDKRIASTRIRLGEIDRWGKVFESRITNHESRISEELRLKLKKPMGKLIKGNPGSLNDLADELRNAVGKTNSPIISTVGDEVTRICNESGIAVNLAIVDFKVNRKEKYRTLSDLGFKSTFARGTLANGVVTVRNPPGHITKELVEAVKNAYLGIITDGKQRIIKVDGEEDLAGVPAILLAPLGSVVLYGQPAYVQNEIGLRRGKPQEGVVMVEVTEEKKVRLLRIMKL